ncbi:MAG: HDIG domain-containing protein [Victivallales bacterium]|nr:HDIG domain-containing protein [Victivallales bacterium]
MKPRQSKVTNITTKSEPPPGEDSSSSVEAAPSLPIESTVGLTEEQKSELAHKRVVRDIQAKTRACMNHAVRVRLKNYRIAWKKYWPLLPVFLATWLIGAICLMPRHFLPSDATVVAIRVSSLGAFQEHLTDLGALPEAAGLSVPLQKLLGDEKRRQMLSGQWALRLEQGIRPDELPPAITEQIGDSFSSLIVHDDGDWPNGHFHGYSSPILPLTLSAAASLTARQFCADLSHPELEEELSQLLRDIGQPSIQYSEELTREFLRHNPPKPLQLSNRAPLLGQDSRLHQIYRPQPSYWHAFTWSNIRHALGSRSFHVNVLVLLAFLIAFSAVVYVIHVDHVTELRRHVLLGLLLCMEFISVYICANYISSHYEVPLPLLLSCLPLAFFPDIIGNLLNERLAIVTAVLMAMLLPLQLNLPSEHFPLFYFSILVTLTAVLCFRQINRRMEFLTRGLIYGLALTGAELLFLLSESRPLSGKDFLIEIVFMLASSLANGVLNGIFCILCMSVLEVLFRLPTALSLTEISNLDSPLMERLRQEAPGTYEHSIAVAALSVSGAHTIGANAKLAYAMALYHDIGKLYSPEHFTENLQNGETTPHLRHTPEDSCEYLREHARFGLRLARQYHLPSLLYPAILQHHGNTIMASFYNQACRQAAEQGLPAPPAEKFRYDQQPPSSREVALIMLADSCEAATRSLTHRKRDSAAEAQRLAEMEEEVRRQNPNASRQEITTLYEQYLSNEESAANAAFRTQLAQRVTAVILGKLNDGQFNQVDLTTRQLAMLAETFVVTLLDKNHTRLEYRS